MPAKERSLLAVALLVTLAAWLLYWFTAAPTFSWGDSADLTLRVMSDADQMFVNTDRDYIMYRTVSQFLQHLPLGDNAGERQNRIAGFFGGLTVGLVTWLTGLLTGRRDAALAAGLSLMVSHTFWLLSVMAEVYTFNLFLAFSGFVSLALWAQTGRSVYLITAAAFAGLCLGHHRSGMVFLVSALPLLLWQWRLIHWPALLVAGVSWAICALPYWQTVAVKLDHGHTLVHSLGFRSLGAPPSLMHEITQALLALGYNFAGLAGLFSLAALYGLMRKRLLQPALLPPLLWALLFFYAAVFVPIPDKFNIYIMFLPTIAVLVGIGWKRWQPRSVHSSLVALTLLALLPPAVYYSTATISDQYKLDLTGARTAPYRNNDYYFLWPPKQGDDGPPRYAREALGELRPAAVLIADYTLWRPLLVVQTLEQVRPDVQLVFVEPLLYKGVADYIASLPEERPVYLATNTPRRYYQFDQIEERFAIRPQGLVYEVLRPR